MFVHVKFNYTVVCIPFQGELLPLLQFNIFLHLELCKDIGQEFFALLNGVHYHLVSYLLQIYFYCNHFSCIEPSQGKIYNLDEFGNSLFFFRCKDAGKTVHFQNKSLIFLFFYKMIYFLPAKVNWFYWLIYKSLFPSSQVQVWWTMHLLLNIVFFFQVITVYICKIIL